MKKFLIILGSFFAVVIVVLLLLPFFYSVDHLRPKIEASINANLRGKVQLGKLSLKAFPSLAIKVDGLTAVAPAPLNKEALATVDAVELRMPLLSLLASPRVTIVLSGARVKIVQNGTQSNLSDFLPAPIATPKAGSPAPSAPPAQALGETLDALPGLVAMKARSARLGFEVVNFDVVVQDLKAPKADKKEIHKISLSLRNVGLSTPIEMAFSSELDLKSGALEVKGPLAAEGKVSLTPEGKSNLVDFDILADESALDIRMKPLFHKAASTPFKIALKGKALQGPVTDVDLSSLELRFADLNARASAKLNNVTAVEKKDAKLVAKLEVDKVKLASFGALVPMVRDYKLGGTASVKVGAQGALYDPALDIAVLLAQVTGATPQLQRPISNLNGQIRVTGTAQNPKIVIDPFSMKIGSGDLSLKATLAGLEKISSSIEITSKRLDLDELMGIAPAKASVTGGGGAAPAPVANTQALDESLDAMAPLVETSLENPLLDDFSSKGRIEFKSVRAAGAEFKDGQLNFTLAKRQFKLFKSGIGAYGGRLSMDGELGLQAKALSYNFQSSLGGVRVQEMILAHAPKWKDAMSGEMQAVARIAGRGLRKAQIAENLSGSLKGDLKDGRLNMPIVQVVSGLMDKLPTIGGKKIEFPNKDQRFKGEFKTLKMDAVIRGRNVNLQDLDVLYNTMSLGIGDMRFKANGNVSFDRQVEMAGTAFLSPQHVKVDALKGPSGQIEIPLKVKGDMSDPKPDYDYTVKTLTPRLAQSALKSQAAQNAIEKIKQKAPEPVRQGIDALKKKFGF